MFLLYANSNIDDEEKSFKLLCIPSKDTTSDHWSKCNASGASCGIWGLSFASCDNALDTQKNNFKPKISWFTRCSASFHYLFHLERHIAVSHLAHALPFDSLFPPLVLSLPLILTLFCHLFASSSFFFLASSSWEILEVSSASSVACAHVHTEWEES